jgi:hypothetical protein
VEHGCAALRLLERLRKAAREGETLSTADLQNERVYIEPLDPSGLPRRDLPTILRGQLTIIRMRAERGVPVSVESLERAERLAQILDSEELAE